MSLEELLSAALCFMSAGSLIWTVLRIGSGRPLVKYEPRRPVPWTGGWLLLAVLIFLLVPSEIHGVARRQFVSRLPLHDQTEFASLPEDAKPGFEGYALVMMQADCAGKLLAAAIVVALLAGIVRADARDLGLSLHRFGRKLRIGLIAFFVITPPTLLLQAAIIKITDFQYTHPLITGLGDRSNRDILYWSLLTAVAVAPLVEEFFFRGLLQGWLERIFFKFQAALNIERLRAQELPASETKFVSGRSPDEVTAAAAEARVVVQQADGTLLLGDLQPGDTASEPIAMGSPSHVPNVIASAVFGLMHWGHGPAPFVLFFFSLGLGYLYRQTHSLWPSIIVHFLLNSFSMAMLIFGLDK